jgi:acyl dehydratase
MAGPEEWRRRTADAFAAIPADAEYVYRRTFTDGDVALFVGVSGDFNPLHQDAEHASLRFGRLIVPGLLTASMLTHIGGMLGFVAGEMHFEYVLPVYVGDTITCTLRVVESDPGRRRMVCVGEFVNEEGKLVLRARVSGYPTRVRLLSQK